MKISDINLYSEKYDLHRDDELKNCIHIIDYDALATDISQCEDYDSVDISFRKVIQQFKGKINPVLLKEKLNENKTRSK